jgi:hypothetical protein
LESQPNLSETAIATLVKLMLEPPTSSTAGYVARILRHQVNLPEAIVVSFTKALSNYRSYESRLAMAQILNAQKRLSKPVIKALITNQQDIPLDKRVAIAKVLSEYPNLLSQILEAMKSI